MGHFIAGALFDLPQQQRFGLLFCHPGTALDGAHRLVEPVLVIAFELPQRLLLPLDGQTLAPGNLALMLNRFPLLPQKTFEVLLAPQHVAFAFGEILLGTPDSVLVPQLCPFLRQTRFFRRCAQ